ncbi:type II secretion system protein GspK, partial [Marinobacter sp. 1Y8]
ESTVYAQQSNAVATDALPNQPFVSIDQLLEVKGVSAETLSVLRPYLTAVPYYVPININTASPVLLAALVDGANSQQMQALVDMRAQQALTSIDAVWQLPIFGSVNDEQRKALTPMLAVDSQVFMALITATDNATVGQARERFATVLISKTVVDNNQVVNSSEAASNNQASNSSEVDGKMPKEVKVVTQRLWAFRPSF